MRALILERSAEALNIIAIGTTPTDGFESLDPNQAWEDISVFLQRVSLVEAVAEPIAVLHLAWDKLSRAEMGRMHRSVMYADAAYEQWLNTVESYLVGNNNQLVRELKPLWRGLIGALDSV